jgi:RNA polymerase sigma-70 factor (ECF subfamily)
MTTTSRTADDTRTRMRTIDAPPRAVAVAVPIGIEWTEVAALVRRQMRSLVGGGSSRDLEDLTQTALERICRNVDRFEGRAEFATYTYRACARVAINHWRWYKRWLRSFERTTEATPEPTADGCDAAELIAVRERLARLERALDRLSADKRAVLTLCELEELPASRVAEILGCPEATIRSRLHRARVDLAKILKSDSESATEESK